jgi:serine phosphatase RsbU (regulator of sigma subunit)
MERHSEPPTAPLLPRHTLARHPLCPICGSTVGLAPGRNPLRAAELGSNTGFGMSAPETLPTSRVDLSRRDTEIAVAVVRTIFLLIVILSPQFARARGMQGNLLVVVTVAAAFYNVSLFILHMQKLSFPRPIIVFVDTLLISLWIYFAGTDGYRYFLMYFAVVVVAGLWFRRGGALVVALLASILYMWAIHYAPLPAGTPRTSLTAVGLQVLFLILTAVLVAVVTSVQERERHELLLSRAVLQQHWERIRMAQHVDEMLRPRRLPNTPGLEIAFRFRPAAQGVSGDYYDVIPIGGRRWGVVIADIRAREEKALFYLPLFKSSLRLVAKRESSPAAVLAQMNHDVWADMEEQSELEAFIGMHYSVIDLDWGTVTCANAGMEPPVLIPAGGGELQEQECGGIVLGVLPRATYQEKVHRVQSGDTIVLFTDGMTEAMNAADEVLGREAFVERIWAERSAPTAEALVQRLFEYVIAYARESRHRDDMTVVAVRVTATDVGAAYPTQDGAQASRPPLAP